MAGKTTSKTLIARRYARAFYDLAVERKVISTVSKDLGGLQASLKTSPAVTHILGDKSLDRDDRLTAVEALVKKGKPHQLTANFLKVLVEADRFSLIDIVIQQFNDIHDDEEGIRHVHAVTASALSKKEQADLKAKLKTALDAKGIDLKMDIDPDILGGMKIRFGSTLVDDTIKNKLNRISQKMKGIA